MYNFSSIILYNTLNNYICTKLVKLYKLLFLHEIYFENYHNIVFYQFTIFSKLYNKWICTRSISNGENLIGVSVYDKLSNKGTTTNQYGFYSITLPKGKYNIVYSFIGLETVTKLIDLNQNQRINISLKENSTQIEEVKITDKRLDENVENTNMSQVKLKIQNVKSIPAILGEIDVLKAAQLLPGISNGGEGNSGLYVRGGGPDQNLVLLDEAVVYNESTLLVSFQYLT